MRNQKNYPLDSVEPFSTLKEMITLRKEKDGGKIAFKFLGENKQIIEKTYLEFYNETVYLGTALSKEGIEKKHVACMGLNSYKWLTVYLSILSSNNVFVPIDKDLPEADIVNVINHSDSEVIFCDKKYVEILLRNKEKIEKIEKIICFEEADGAESFEALIKKGEELFLAGDRSFLEAEANDVEALKMILYTSGTTGMSKGVMLSEKNLVSCVYHGLRVSTVFDVCLSVLPYHHTYESVCGILVSLHKGATICINKNLKQVLNSLKIFKPTYIMLVPAFAELFYSKIKKNIRDGGKEKGFEILIKVSRFLRSIGIDARKKLFKQVHDVFGGNMIKIVCGGAPIRPEIGKFFDDIGINLISGYGITECSPLVSANRDFFNDPATVGVCLPCIEVKIDEPNEEGIGEIIVCGDTVMMGYYKAEDLTREAIKDGWFYTGDYGMFNKKGQLVITGRKKNLIVLSNGKNVFPEEIENYISGIDEVKEVVVYSPKSESGEERQLTAKIYLDPEMTISKDELKKKVSEALKELPMYKQVREIIIMEEEFEKTTSNKIKRQKYVN